MINEPSTQYDDSQHGPQQGRATAQTGAHEAALDEAHGQLEALQRDLAMLVAQATPFLRPPTPEAGGVANKLAEVGRGASPATMSVRGLVADIRDARDVVAELIDRLEV